MGYKGQAPVAKVHTQFVIADIGAGKGIELERYMRTRQKATRTSKWNHNAGSPRNRNTTTFTAEYGPVRGCWASDIKKRVASALRRIGSCANVETRDYVRITVER